MVSIFGAEQALVNPLQQRDRETLLGLAIGAIIGTITPIILTTQLPTPLKSISLLAGVGCSGAAAVVSGNKIARKQNKFAKIIDTTQEDAVLSRMESEIAYAKMLDDIYNNNRILDVVMQLPVDQQSYWLNYFGVSGLAASTIAVESRAVLEPAETVAYASSTGTIARSGAITKAYSQSPDLPFPEEDLALTLAQTTIDPDDSGSTLIACPRGTGKSTLLRTAISYANSIHEGAIDFSVFAGKDGENYCGLEDSDQDYLYSGSKQNVEETYSRLNAIEQRCEAFAGFPTVTVLDEYNNTLAAAATYDSLERGRNYRKRIAATTYERVTKGRSKLVCDWITSHSPLVQDVDLNSQIQNSVYIVILARGSSYGTIEQALKNKIQVVDNATRREELQQQLADYRNSSKFDRNRVMALTNLLGDWRLVFLPHYGEVGSIDRGTLNQTGEEIAEDDGTPNTPIAQPGQNAIDLMHQWMDELHRVVTDAELTAQFKALTGRSLDEQGLRYLKQGLGLDGDDNTPNTETEEIW